jgi:hypothetical protein
MRTALPVIALLLAACGGPSEPPSAEDTPAGRACARAYSSTVHSLDELLRMAGVRDRPELPTREAYVEACVAQGFTEAQLRCLDPKLREADESCTETLAEVAEKEAALTALFEAAMAAAAPPPPPDPPPAPEGEGEGEAPADGAAPAAGTP